MDNLWIGLGGALGAVARYQVGRLIVRTPDGFPWATLAVNLVGALLLAALAHAALVGRVSEPARLALAVGVLGGFTTYSSFNQETLELLRDGAAGRAALYLAATLLGGLAAGGLGWLAARAALR